LGRVVLEALVLVQMVLIQFLEVLLQLAVVALLEVELEVLVGLVVVVLLETLQLEPQQQVKAILAGLVQHQAMLLVAVVEQVQPE
jgi:hypothetical protein